MRAAGDPTRLADPIRAVIGELDNEQSIRSIAQRTREIGVRVALGASPAAIRNSIVGRALRSVLAGTALGCVAALLLARAIEQQLYAVNALDPWSFFMAPVVLVATAVIACYAPARAAARVDLVVALRAE